MTPAINPAESKFESPAGSFTPQAPEFGRPFGSNLFRNVGIDSLDIVPDVEQEIVHVTVGITGKPNHHKVSLVVEDGDRTGAGKSVRLPSGMQLIDQPIDNPKLWSPDSPFLYGLTVKLD